MCGGRLIDTGCLIVITPHRPVVFKLLLTQIMLILESGTKCHLCKQRGLTVSLSFLRNYGNVLVLGGMTGEETSSAGCPVLLFLKH